MTTYTVERFTLVSALASGALKSGVLLKKTRTLFSENPAMYHSECCTAVVSSQDTEHMPEQVLVKCLPLGFTAVEKEEER